MFCPRPFLGRGFLAQAQGGDSDLLAGCSFEFSPFGLRARVSCALSASRRTVIHTLIIGESPRSQPKYSRNNHLTITGIQHAFSVLVFHPKTNAGFPRSVDHACMLRLQGSMSMIWLPVCILNQVSSSQKPLIDRIARRKLPSLNFEVVVTMKPSSCTWEPEREAWLEIRDPK